jgi:hypothetical protein
MYIAFIHTLKKEVIIMNIMKKITLGTLLTGALLLPQQSHAELTNESANVTMSVFFICSY